MSTSEITNRILRLPEVKQRTGLGRSSIYAGMKDGSFPEHIRLGVRSVGWPENVINEWIADRIRASQTQAK